MYNISPMVEQLSRRTERLRTLDIAKLTFMMVVVAYMITSLNTSPWFPTQVYSKIFKESQ